MQNKFPQRIDYPDSLSILDNPHKNIDLYIKICVASASAYFETDPFTRHLFKKRFYLVEKYLERETKGHFQRTLDVGCGIGFFLPILSSLSDKVTELDYTNDLLQYAQFMGERRNIKNVHFVQGDIKNLPFPDQSFDLVVCMSVLEHFKDLEQPLGELKRVLSPDGFLVLGYPTETPLFRFLHKKASRIFSKRRKINRIFDNEKASEHFAIPHLSDAEKITKAVHNAGFKKKVSGSINLLPFFLRLYTIKILQKS